MFRKKVTPNEFTEISPIAKKILEEEHLPLSRDGIDETVLTAYASSNSTIRHTIKSLYEGKITLRRAVSEVVESYYNHNNPYPRKDMAKLSILIDKIADHIEGIGWSSTYDFLISGDYDPTRHDYYMLDLIDILHKYTNEVNEIDRQHNQYNDSFFDGVQYGNGNESKIIANHNVYVAAKNGLFERKCDQIAGMISQNANPSDFLRFLSENWVWYITPPVFINQYKLIDYCILLCEDFPDTPDARQEFRQIVRQL